MSQRRSYAEAATAGPSAPYSDKNLDQSKSAVSKEQRHGAKRQRTTRGDKLSWVRKRARAIERTFHRDAAHIPADKAKDLRQELAAHKQRIDEEVLRRKKSKMISKYHMVRFFERKKAMRLAKQLQGRLKQASDADERAALRAELHIAEVDVDYAQYFPFMEPYVSMYSSAAAKPAAGGQPSDDAGDGKGEDEGEGGTSKAAAALHAPRPPLWGVVEKAREEGQQALERLRDRQPPSRHAAESLGNPGKLATKQSKGAAAGAKKGAGEPKPTRKGSGSGSGSGRGGPRGGEEDGGVSGGDDEFFGPEDK